MTVVHTKLETPAGLPKVIRRESLDFRLSYGSFSLLRDLVHERTGLNFEDDKMDVFLDKLSPLVVKQNLDSLLDYYYVLKNDLGSSAEWRKVLDALTVQESYFWREVDHIRVLVNEIVPQYFRAHPHHALNIWSAACAAGEEPLTIAMALQEAGWFDLAQINIYASDASARAIKVAQTGIYRERSFRNLPPELREKYFVCADAGAGGLSQVSRQLHSRVRWGITNLMSQADVALIAMASTVIFCRNVFIYFSESAIRKTVQVFAEQMQRPGYLFVGTAESLSNFTPDFELREIGDTYVHIRN